MVEMVERLERIFYLIPYVLEHQGARLNELAEVLGTKEKELLKDLHDLFMSGPNEWQQISVYVDKDRKVFVENADFFARPMSLTIPEAFSLTLAGDIFRETREVKEIETLEEALKKIYDIIPKDIRNKAKFMERRIAITPVEHERADLIKVIEEAIKEQKELQIEYYTYSRDDFSKRVVRPYGLINYAENWYLAGFCLLRNEERVFRVDRIKNVVKTKNKFDLPGDFNINKFVSDRMYQYPVEGMVVKIKIDSSIARWFEESIEGGEFVKNIDGSIIVTFYTSTYNWIIKWVLPHAEHIQILEPKFLVDEIVESAAEILKVYKAE